MKTMTLKANKAPWTLSDIFAQVEKKQVPVTIKENLVVLSCCLHRLLKSGVRPGTYSITNPELIQLIMDEDRVLASKITEHYNKKIVWAALKGRTQTDYRRALAQLLNTESVDDIFTYPENLLGVAYRLPPFYEYDLRLESIFDSYDTMYPKELKTSFYRQQIRVLKFKDKIRVETKHSKGNEFWFTDDDNDHYSLFVPDDNNLRNLFEYKVTTSNAVKIYGDFIGKRKDNYPYYSARTWRLEI